MSAGKTTDAGFEADVIKSDVPVLVDFWAEWCGPCKAIAPALDAIAAEQAGQLKVIKLNVDENEAMPEKYGVRSIPTLLLFKGGEVVGKKIGGTTKSEIERLIKSA